MNDNKLNERLAFNIGRKLAIKTEWSANDFNADIEYRKDSLMKNLRMQGLTDNEIESIIASNLCESHLKDGFQYQKGLYAKTR